MSTHSPNPRQPLSWLFEALPVLWSFAVLLAVASCAGGGSIWQSAPSAVSRVEVGGKQALLVASYAYVAAARDAADRIRAGRMTEAQAARAQALGARVRDALVAAHDVADGFSRARGIEQALSATAELVAIVEGSRP